jgi:hypothetical protein
MSYVPGNTNDAHFAVQYHVALKGMQAGTLLGAFGLAPLAYLVSGRKKGRTFFSYLRSVHFFFFFFLLFLFLFLSRLRFG